MIKAPSVCPACENRFTIKKLECDNCGTALENDFSFNIFERLNEQQQEFILVFLSCDGSIRALEQTLKISYPTVKNRLNEIKRILIDENTQLNGNMAVLERLEKGEIDAETARDLIIKNSKSPIKL